MHRNGCGGRPARPLPTVLPDEHRGVSVEADSAADLRLPGSGTRDIYGSWALESFTTLGGESTDIEDADFYLTFSKGKVTNTIDCDGVKVSVSAKAKITDSEIQVLESKSAEKNGCEVSIERMNATYSITEGKLEMTDEAEGTLVLVRID